MRKIREVLRLRWKCGLKERPTARACRVSRSTVGLYLERADRAGLQSWEEVEGLDDLALDRLLFPPPEKREEARPLPRWSAVHTELQKPQDGLPLPEEPGSPDPPLGGTDTEHVRGADYYAAPPVATPSVEEGVSC